MKLYLGLALIHDSDGRLRSLPQLARGVIILAIEVSVCNRIPVSQGDRKAKCL